MKAFPQAAADLLSAREALIARGFAKGTRQDFDGKVCLRGAIGIAVCGSACEYDEWQREVEAAARIDVLLPASNRIASDPVAFNNDPATTKDDVLALLDAAASLALDGADVADLP